FTRLIGGQRDSKILPRQGNQRIAIEDGGLVGELGAAEQGGNRGGGLDFDQRLIGSRGLQIGLRARNVLVLLEPEKNRQVETDGADPIARLIRCRGEAGDQVIVVLNARGEV